MQLIPCCKEVNSMNESMALFNKMNTIYIFCTHLTIHKMQISNLAWFIHLLNSFTWLKKLYIYQFNICLNFGERQLGKSYFDYNQFYYLKVLSWQWIFLLFVLNSTEWFFWCIVSIFMDHNNTIMLSNPYLKHRLI